MNRKFSVLNLVTLALCVIFTFLQITTIIDLSFLAFWVALVFTAFLVFFGFYKLHYKKDAGVYKIVRKLYEYVPFIFLAVFVLRRAGTFGTSFAYDLISVIIWIAVSVVSFVTVQLYLSEKNFFKKKIRAISTARLYVTIVHLQPINVVVYNDPQWKSNLGASFALRCFQRLSTPNAATRQCPWRDNRCTGGSSNTVLSY